MGESLIKSLRAWKLEKEGKDPQFKFKAMVQTCDPIEIERSYFDEKSQKWKTFQQGRVVPIGGEILLEVAGVFGKSEKGLWAMADGVRLPYDLSQQIATAAAKQLSDQQRKTAAAAAPAANGNGSAGKGGGRLATAALALLVGLVSLLTTGRGAMAVPPAGMEGSYTLEHPVHGVGAIELTWEDGVSSYVWDNGAGYSAEMYETFLTEWALDLYGVGGGWNGTYIYGDGQFSLESPGLGWGVGTGWMPPTTFGGSSVPEPGAAVAFFLTPFLLLCQRSRRGSPAGL